MIIELMLVALVVLPVGVGCVLRTMGEDQEDAPLGMGPLEPEEEEPHG